MPAVLPKLAQLAIDLDIKCRLQTAAQRFMPLLDGFLLPKPGTQPFGHLLGLLALQQSLRFAMDTAAIGRVLAVNELAVPRKIQRWCCGHGMPRSREGSHGATRGGSLLLGLPLGRFGGTHFLTRPRHLDIAKAHQALHAGT